MILTTILRFHDDVLLHLPPGASLIVVRREAMKKFNERAKRADPNYGELQLSNLQMSVPEYVDNISKWRVSISADNVEDLVSL